MLTIKINQHLYSVNSESVQCIDDVDTVTPLPFSARIFDGLTNFNSRPFIQIDLEQALQPPIDMSTQERGKKRIILASLHGDYSLLITEAMSLAAHATAPKNDSAPPRLLPLTEILPPNSHSINASGANTVAPPENRQKLHLLLVTSAGKTVALLTHNIERIQELVGLEMMTPRLAHGGATIDHCGVSPSQARWT